MKRIYTVGMAMLLLAGAPLGVLAAQRISVGGDVMAAKLLTSVPPVYPELAKQARIQGVVRLSLVIAKDGTVQNMTVLSGHPLLVKAAMDAVKQWTYQPTIVNSLPVEVSTTAEVNFFGEQMNASGTGGTGGMVGMVMGTVVKSMPYSGEEVSEMDQTLGDGTRIHSETRTKVYRDGEGRLRRETPTSITIFDPVAGTGYTLDPATHTAHKIGISMTASSTYASAPATSAEEMDAQMRLMKSVMGPSPALMAAGSGLGGPSGQAKRESLGAQTMEGLQVKGTRTTSTIPEGAIGNSRAIETVSERWFSADLQTVVMTKHSDPRSGTQTFQLRNVLRGEPSPSLFQLPSDYTVVSGKKEKQE